MHRFEAAGLGKAPFTFVDMQRIVYQACQGAPVQPGTSCDYCATAISYAFMVRSADGRRFKVGCDCIEKVGDAGLLQAAKRARKSFDREQRAAARERRSAEHARTRREAARIRRARTRQQALEFARAHGLVACFLHARKGPKAAIAREFLGKLTTYGTLSDAQLAFLKSIGTPTTAAPSGRVTFRATIESIKSREGFRGVEYKMTVRADDGFRAWMTAPNGLLMSGDGIGLERFRGCRIEVTATLEPSREDAGFAFGKRPKVALIEAEAAA